MSNTGDDQPRDGSETPAEEVGAAPTDAQADAQADAEAAMKAGENTAEVDPADVDDEAHVDEEDGADVIGNFPDAPRVAEADDAEVEVSELAQAQAQAGELKDQLLRALAETENVRRRAAREKEDASRYAIANFARDMLGVSDNMHRALEVVPEDARAGESPIATLVEGIEMTERELLAALDRHGIKKIEPLGQKFDHNLHQAMFEVPDDSVASGTVVQVMQAGYVIGERLLRPAMVGVAKTAPAPAADETETPEENTGGSVDTSV